MQRRTAQYNAELDASYDAMMTQQIQQQVSTSKDRSCTGRLQFRRQEAIGSRTGGVSGDLRHGGDVGLQGDCAVTRNYLRPADLGMSADIRHTKGEPAWSGVGEGRIASVAGRRTLARATNRKSQCTRQTNEEGHVKRQKKKSDQRQAFLRKAAAIRKSVVQCLEGQSQMLDCLTSAEDDAAAAAVGGGGEFPNRNRTKSVGVKSSASYTICTPPLQDAEAFEEQDAKRAAAEDGADGERTKKCSGHRNSASVIHADAQQL